MSDDLKALRALVEALIPQRVGAWWMCCRAQVDHRGGCPVAAAEAALARLEARELIQSTQYDAFAEGFARAKEKAVRAADEWGPRMIPYDERGEESYNNGVMDTASKIGDILRKLEP